ncbi:hypothetical protein QR680_000581 [Steinernema hermaphroditum]|uniref:Uncharacterized protein n=1 Tax=Steinernema hermaphroditum TaxID=289476 RepID=A0AA39LDU8_9BILA|nr:hypothetical protein QR680_000581 [Steinernema hermaphroditum]
MCTFLAIIVLSITFLYLSVVFVVTHLRRRRLQGKRSRLLQAPEGYPIWYNYRHYLREIIDHARIFWTVMISCPTHVTYLLNGCDYAAVSTEDEEMTMETCALGETV